MIQPEIVLGHMSFVVAGVIAQPAVPLFGAPVSSMVKIRVVLGIWNGTDILILKVASPAVEIAGCTVVSLVLDGSSRLEVVKGFVIGIEFLEDALMIAALLCAATGVL